MVSNSQKPIFVVSTGRSGSKMIASVMAMHPSVLGLHEPRPLMNLEAYSYWNGNIKRNRIQESVIHKRDHLIQQTIKNNFVYFESSHFCSHLIPILYEKYEAKFIHLIRDGRKFLISGLNRDWWFSNRLDKRQKEIIIDYVKVYFRRKFFIDIGREWHDHRLNPPKKYKTKLEKTSWLWLEINEVILNSLKMIPAENQITLRLEDFKKNKIIDLLNYLNLGYDEDLLEKMYLKSLDKENKTTSKKIDSFSDLKLDEQESFWDITNEMMLKFGYEK
jgi:hypothetical protein